jgi:hypothetical protein
MCQPWQLLEKARPSRVRPTSTAGWTYMTYGVMDKEAE